MDGLTRVESEVAGPDGGAADELRGGQQLVVSDRTRWRSTFRTFSQVGLARATGTTGG